MDRIRRFLAQLGGKLGITVAVVGFLAIFLGWNGAASFNDIRQQFPYLLSGGLAGLALVVVGAALVLVEAVRAERAELQSAIEDLRAAVDRLAAARPAAAAPVAGGVVAGTASYHEPTCRLVEGRTDLDVVPVADATARGLMPCRICHPTGNGARASRHRTRAS